LDGKRSYSFIGASKGFDYLTQLPTGERELMFGGGIGHAANEGLAEVGVAQDDKFDGDVASYLGGALPSHFGVENWGAEYTTVNSSDANSWYSGRTKALWTGTIGWSADGLFWVGRVPDEISGRKATQSTTVSGEWITAGFSGEGMSSAWLCGHALGKMLLANDANLELHWFPAQMKITQERWRDIKLEGFGFKDLLEYGLGH
jgi:glycine/D-amino acid oxidase-like deaminating enzyme